MALLLRRGPDTLAEDRSVLLGYIIYSGEQPFTGHREKW